MSDFGGSGMGIISGVARDDGRRRCVGCRRVEPTNPNRFVEGDFYCKSCPPRVNWLPFMAETMARVESGARLDRTLRKAAHDHEARYGKVSR